MRAPGGYAMIERDCAGVNGGHGGHGGCLSVRTVLHYSSIIIVIANNILVCSVYTVLHTKLPTSDFNNQYVWAQGHSTKIIVRGTRSMLHIATPHPPVIYKGNFFFVFK